MTLDTRNKRRAALGWYPVHDDQPAEGDVRSGVGYADATRTGTLVTGEIVNTTVVVGEGLTAAIIEDVLGASITGDVLGMAIIEDVLGASIAGDVLGASIAENVLGMAVDD